MVRWRFRRFTPRMRDQLVEAQRLLGTGIRLTPTQGSYSNAVGASAGTHAREAVDLSVRGVSRSDETQVIRVLDRVGIVAWVRTAPPFTSRHIHGLPRGGDLSPSAQRQVDSADRGGDGLASNGPDPHAALRTRTTWEAYCLSRWPLPDEHVFGDRSSIPLWNVAKRRRTHDGTGSSAHAAWVRRIQDEVGVRKTGRFGPATASAVRLRQRRDGIDQTGTVGPVTAKAWGLLD